MTTPLTDRELQSLRNDGFRSELAAEEIERLRAELAECGGLIKEQARLLDIIHKRESRLLTQVEQLQRELAAKQAQIPEVLFDGFTVWQALTAKAQARTSPENVSAVLDAVVRLMRAAQPAPVAQEPKQ